MNEFIINLDTEIFLWLNSIHSIYWDVVMKIISGRLTWGVMYLFLIYAIIRTFGWKTTLVMVLMTIVTIVLADQITASILRPIFERMRPSNPDNPISGLVHVVNNYRGGRFGFPSSHAANTFACATMMSLLFWRWRFSLFMILWAILVCYSRIYLGVHYPGDLLAGTVIGAMCGALTYMCGAFMTRAWGGNLRPRKQALMRTTNLEGLNVVYHPVDITIGSGIATILFILLFSSAIV